MNAQEQWAAVVPGEQLGFGALAQGLTSVVVLKVEESNLEDGLSVVSDWDLSKAGFMTALKSPPTTRGQSISSSKVWKSV